LDIRLRCKIKPEDANYVCLLSEEGDTIGKGKIAVLKDGEFFSYGSNVKRVLLRYDRGSLREDTWLLELASPSALMPGVYRNVSRYPFNSPTLRVSNVRPNSIPCRSISGAFEIVDILFDQGELACLNAVFEQRCNDGSPLYGVIHYHNANDLSCPTSFQRAFELAELRPSNSNSIKTSATYAEEQSYFLVFSLLMAILFLAVISTLRRRRRAQATEVEAANN